VPHRHMPTGDWDAHPRTRASQEPIGHHQNKIAGDGRNCSPKRSSCLRFQMFCVEMSSLLPKSVMWGLRPAKPDENRPEPGNTPQWLERRD